MLVVVRIALVRSPLIDVRSLVVITSTEFLLLRMREVGQALGDIHTVDNRPWVVARRITATGIVH